MEYFFGIIQVEETDSIEIILEKLQEALSRTINNDRNKNLKGNK
ncbi:MAG: hypothetical protein ACI9RG_000747 [Sulfurimonas sp.]|jgi:hypothetical protein